jgi:NDP-sugar pyrophosphorylase family protein
MALDYQIIIPMSGFGERFRRAGYQIPKPLIEVEGRPIISHVIDLFPGEKDFIFICNQEHLDNADYGLRGILERYCPTGRVVGIESHRLGPMHAVQQICGMLDQERPVVINYCDFSCYWDWVEFKKFNLESKCDGSIPAYKGFHPHSLGTTNYAYLKEFSGWIKDIQEKRPFTENRMQEYASTGTYYFASAKVMSAAFDRAREMDLNVGGEFYISLAFKPMLEEGKLVAVFPVQHFMQWGTPEDLEEYLYWSRVFKLFSDGEGHPPKASGSVVIPMAGMGKRFADEGYVLTKPLIPISGLPMAEQAIGDLPPSKYQSFVLRVDMPGVDSIRRVLQDHYPDSVISLLPGLTDGQASTALFGLEALEGAGHVDLNPIIFAACDNGVIFDYSRYKALLEDSSVDVIVWGIRGYTNAIRHPEMYGWIDADNDIINHISVKNPLGSTKSDPIVIGTFTFKNKNNAADCINSLIARDGRINGEFYLDSCINDALDMGLKCRLFEVESYISWGTPNDLKTFEYWQSCFHKWESHPYDLNLDARVSGNQIHELNARYSHVTTKIPNYPLKKWASHDDGP